MLLQFMLDNEMILSMLRDVVAGLAFLHAAVPPILHQDLRSSKILLDSSCRAHLSDYHQDVVRCWNLPVPLKLAFTRTTVLSLY